MSSFLQAINNNSGATIHITVLRDADSRSYDLVLGPGQSFDYQRLSGFGPALVPEPKSAAEFENLRITVDVGQFRYCLFVYDGSIRAAVGNTFSTDADKLTGFSAPGTFTLIVTPGNGVEGHAYAFVTRPYLAATSWITGRYSVSGVDDQGRLLEKAYLTSAWAGWTSVGRPTTRLTGPVTAVSWATDRYSIFALGADGDVYERFWKTRDWDEWIQHKQPAGVKLVELSSVYWVTARFGIYATASNGRLYEKWYATDHWSDWNDLDKPMTTRLTGPVTAVSWLGFRYGIYALGDDGNVWQKWWASGSWSGWEIIARPPVLLKTITSVAWQDRTYAVAGVGVDGQLWILGYDDGWQSWRQAKLNVPLKGPVTSVCWWWTDSTRVAYYAIGQDELLYQYWRDEWSVVENV
jgi:hypothetical protein